MYTKRLLKLALFLLFAFLGSNNFYAFAETCSSGSGTSCSMSCSEGTLTLVCNKREETCFGSCSKANNQESAAYNLLADIYVATGKRINLDQIVRKLKDAPMEMEGGRYDLSFGYSGNITVIIKTDFTQFYRSDWNRAVDRAARQLEYHLRENLLHNQKIKRTQNTAPLIFGVGGKRCINGGIALEQYELRFR